MATMTDEEALAIITALSTGGYDTDEKDSEMMGAIDDAYPGITDLIFYDDRGLTPEQILAEAKRHKPIQLGN